jgi:threonine aldolase
MTIDLRSDTVTRPTPAMLAAMAVAETGDDVYGEDPTVRRLEERVAGLLGHEAGLFTVSGSLANVLGVRAHVRPGSELLCEAQAHVVRFEMGAHAVSGGVTTRTWSHPRGHVDLDQITGLMSPDAGPYLVSTAAIAVENTHNAAGGTVQPIDALRELRELADASGIRLHLDGARLWNAHIATGVAVDTYGEQFHTASVCLSKGLGAPIGSVLTGPRDVIDDARIWRKRLGAGWRQAGVLAAAGLYALDHHVGRLADDHANARSMAEIIADVHPDVVDPDGVETNIVLLEVGVQAAHDLVERARAEGVLCGIIAPGVVRLITHLDVSATDAVAAAKTIAGVIA